MRLTVLVLLAFSVALSACSKTTTTTTPTQTASPSPSETDQVSATCGPEVAQRATLSSGFPALTDISFHTSTKSGPSTIVSGSSKTDMDALFTELKTAFGSNGFGVTKSEKDVHDAEVDFKGKKTTGLVKLQEKCTGRTEVTVIVRPA